MIHAALFTMQIIFGYKKFKTTSINIPIQYSHDQKRN